MSWGYYGIMCTRKRGNGPARKNERKEMIRDNDEVRTPTAAEAAKLIPAIRDAMVANGAVRPRVGYDQKLGLTAMCEIPAGKARKLIRELRKKDIAAVVPVAGIWAFAVKR